MLEDAGGQALQNNSTASAIATIDRRSRRESRKKAVTRRCAVSTQLPVASEKRAAGAERH